MKEMIYEETMIEKIASFLNHNLRMLPDIDEEINLSYDI
jgi:hypothetical protein